MSTTEDQDLALARALAWRERPEARRVRAEANQRDVRDRVNRRDPALARAVRDIARECGRGSR